MERKQKELDELKRRLEEEQVKAEKREEEVPSLRRGQNTWEWQLDQQQNEWLPMLVEDERGRLLKQAEAEASQRAARDVQAIMQRMISANVEKRKVRESLKAQLQEQKKRASEFEAKYLQLQAEEESRKRGQTQVLHRLIRDKEALEQSTGRLQEQLAKANMAANELEAKLNQERLKLEAANQVAWS